MEYDGASTDSMSFWNYFMNFQGEDNASWNNFAAIFETYLRANYPQQVAEIPTTLPPERVLRYAFGRGAAPGRADSRQPVTRKELELFLLRFGPLKVCLVKAAGSLFEEQGCLELWFHGYLTREEAEGQLSRDPCPGSFLFRLSNTQPRICLSYREHEANSLKHTLLYNLGTDGYVTDKNRPRPGPGVSGGGDRSSPDRGGGGVEVWPNLREFVSMHRSTLSCPVASVMQAACRQELDLLVVQARLPPSPRGPPDNSMHSESVRKAREIFARAQALVFDDLQEGEDETQVLESALTMFQQVIEMARMPHAREVNVQAKSLRLMGDIMWKLDRQGEGVEQYLRCLALLEEVAEEAEENGSPAKNFRLLSHLHKQLAWYFLHEGDPIKALDHFSDLIACTTDMKMRHSILEEFRENYQEFRDVTQGITRGCVDGVLEEGITFFHKEDYAPAGEKFASALRDARCIGEAQLEARALGNLGTVDYKTHRFAAAISRYTVCVQLLRQLKDSWSERTMERKILNYLVICCIQAEQWMKAKRFNEQLLLLADSRENAACLQRLKIRIQEGLDAQEQERKNRAKSGQLAGGWRGGEDSAVGAGRGTGSGAGAGTGNAEREPPTFQQRSQTPEQGEGQRYRPEGAVQGQGHKAWAMGATGWEPGGGGNEVQAQKEAKGNVEREWGLQLKEEGQGAVQPGPGAVIKRHWAPRVGRHVDGHPNPGLIFASFEDMAEVGVNGEVGDSGVDPHQLPRECSGEEDGLLLSSVPGARASKGGRGAKCEGSCNGEGRAEEDGGSGGQGVQREGVSPKKGPTSLGAAPSVDKPRRVSTKKKTSGQGAPLAGDVGSRGSGEHRSRAGMDGTGGWRVVGKEGDQGAGLLSRTRKRSPYRHRHSITAGEPSHYNLGHRRAHTSSGEGAGKEKKSLDTKQMFHTTGGSIVWGDWVSRELQEQGWEQPRAVLPLTKVLVTTVQNHRPPQQQATAASSSSGDRSLSPPGQAVNRYGGGEETGRGVGDYAGGGQLKGAQGQQPLGDTWEGGVGGGHGHRHGHGGRSSNHHHHHHHHWVHTEDQRSLPQDMGKNPQREGEHSGWGRARQRYHTVARGSEVADEVVDEDLPPYKETDPLRTGAGAGGGGWVGGRTERGRRQVVTGLSPTRISPVTKGVDDGQDEGEPLPLYSPAGGRDGGGAGGDYGNPTQLARVLRHRAGNHDHRSNGNYSSSSPTV